MPMSDKIIDLIQFIVCYASERDIKLTTVRLVKFIYLADLYHAGYFSGKTLTALPWAFVNYGPYCREVMESIEHAVLHGVISKQTFESKYADSKDYNIFFCKDDVTDKLRDSFPPEVTSKLQKAIKRYGDDTASLLDYVYFETEPMMDVKKGDTLDFAKAKLEERRKMPVTKKLSKEKIELVKRNVKLLGEKFKQGQINLTRDDEETAKYKDELYYSTLEYIDGEPLQIGLKGIATIID